MERGKGEFSEYLEALLYSIHMVFMLRAGKAATEAHGFATCSRCLEYQLANNAARL